MSLMPHPFEHLTDLRTTAVNHHYPDSHQAQQDDVTHDGPPQLLRDHGIAAIFDNNGLSSKLLNIGQSLHQSLGLLRMRGHVDQTFPLEFQRTARLKSGNLH